MKISVILTLYNSEKIVLRTIQSILAQEGIGKLFDLELIVIDDCSTDGTRSILDQAHIAYLSTPVNSGGPNRGRNIGLRAATGDYITIVDHDDEWKPWRIKAILPYLDQSSILTSGYLTKYLNNGKEYEVVAARNTELLRFPKNATFLQKLTKSNQGQNTYLGCIVYPQHLKDILFEEHFGMVDYDWVLRLFHQQESLEVCQALYTRYVDQANLSRNENYRRKDFFYSLYTLDGYKLQYPKAHRIGYRRLHGSRARYFYVNNQMQEARFYLVRSELTWKSIGYFLTSFLGSSWITKKYRVFE